MTDKSGSKGTSGLGPFNRRHFLMAAGSAAILPSVLQARAAQSTESKTPANNRINLGVIGMGWQGPGNTKAFLASDDCQVVAACDIDKIICRPPSRRLMTLTEPRIARAITIIASCWLVKILMP